MHARARRLAHGAQEGAGAAFAVGPGDVDDRRQGALGVAELLQQAQQPVEAEVDQPRVQIVQPIDDRLDPALVRQAASGSSSGAGARSRPMTRPSTSRMSPRLTTISTMPCA